MSCFITHYASPLGRLLLAADEEGLTGLWLEGQKYFAAGLPQQREEQRTPALEEACHRVVGSGGSLTGYAGGLENKIKLLELESADLGGLYRPTKGTAL